MKILSSFDILVTLKTLGTLGEASLAQFKSLELSL